MVYVDKNCILPLFTRVAESRSRRFLSGVGFLRTLRVQLNHFLHGTHKLGILIHFMPIEMAQFLLKLLLKQIILVVYHITIAPKTVSNF